MQKKVIAGHDVPHGSLFVKREAIQNRHAAPNTRQLVISKGVTALANTIFETGAITPHMISAPSIAPMPLQFLIHHRHIHLKTGQN